MDAKPTSLDGEAAYALARECGFTHAGLVALPYGEQSRDADRFKEWIEAGYAGTMQYLSRVNENGELVRARAATPFPWARSAIVCFASYHTGAPLSTATDHRGAGWIARYAWSGRMDANGERRPSDYHKVLLKRLNALDAKLREQHDDFESRAYVDTGPLVERSLATAAGLGWTGKNTCLIHPQFGSFAFLAVLLTSLDVRADETTAKIVTDHCGTCQRCIEACPTGALIEPYRMDATKCIAYLTIEYKGAIAPELMEGIGRQVFGCDICQDVCPWNSPRRTPIAADSELGTRAELVNPALEWLAAMDESAWERMFNGSPVRRAGFAAMRRNIAIAMGNSGERSFVPRLNEWVEAADQWVRGAARWALSRLER